MHFTLHPQITNTLSKIWQGCLWMIIPNHPQLASFTCNSPNHVIIWYSLHFLWSVSDICAHKSGDPIVKYIMNTVLHFYVLRLWLKKTKSLITNHEKLHYSCVPNLNTFNILNCFLLNRRSSTTINQLQPWWIINYDTKRHN